MDRFAEVVYAEIKKAMDRSDRVKRNVEKSMARFGVSVVTDAVIKQMIRTMMSKFLSNISEENLPQNFTLRLFPGLDTETTAIPIQVVGYSRKVPGAGIAVDQAELHASTVDFVTKLGATFRERHPSLKVTTEARQGLPTTMLDEAARDIGASLIVMGNHHHGTIASIVVDAVAGHLPAIAPCPVAVIPVETNRTS